MEAWPVHPAYTDPSLPGFRVRKWFAEAQTSIEGDADKATKVIYNLALLSEPPLRLALGKDAIHYTREKIKSLTADVDAYESWSNDLGLENKRGEKYKATR